MYALMMAGNWNDELRLDETSSLHPSNIRCEEEESRVAGGAVANVTAF